MRRLDFYSPYQFALFRIIFGVYLIIHFIPFLKYGPDVYSRAGSVPNPVYNWTYGLFPNFLYYYDSPELVIGVIGVMIILALMYTLGIYRQVAALLLWYGWACLFCRNNYAGNPSIASVGWLLLASVLVPKGEPLALEKRDPEWTMPPLIFWGAWLVMAVSYSASGFLKIPSPSWLDGSAMFNAVSYSMTRDYFLIDWFLALPEPVSKFISYFALAAEVFFLPLCVFSAGRLLAWAGMVGMHLSLLLMFGFPDLTFGALMIHLFTFDPRWIPGRSQAKPKVKLFFDGVCGLCNRTVDFLMAEDRRGIILFAPLQGTTAAKELPDKAVRDLESLVLSDDGKLYFRSTAVIRALSATGGLWGLARILYLVPCFIRDFGYRIVATNRYRWFGQLDTCRLPTPAERARFLP